MSSHMQYMSEKAYDFVWEGMFNTTFSELLEAQKSRYRMASQTETHLAVAGGTSKSDTGGPAIELF